MLFLKDVTKQVRNFEAFLKLYINLSALSNPLNPLPVCVMILIPKINLPYDKKNFGKFGKSASVHKNIPIQF